MSTLTSNVLDTSALFGLNWCLWNVSSPNLPLSLLCLVKRRINPPCSLPYQSYPQKNDWCPFPRCAREHKSKEVLMHLNKNALAFVVKPTSDPPQGKFFFTLTSKKCSHWRLTVKSVAYLLIYQLLQCLSFEMSVHNSYAAYLSLRSLWNVHGKTARVLPGMFQDLHMYTLKGNVLLPVPTLHLALELAFLIQAWVNWVNTLTE